MGKFDREMMLVFYLAEDGELVAHDVYSEGTSASFATGYRLLFERSFRHSARGLILAHNHPSGVARPSSRDTSSTRALEALAAPMEIKVVDHLIVAGRSVFSMRAAGLLG